MCVLIQIIIDFADGMKHWSQTVDDNVDKPKTWWYDAPRPVDVEMT